MTRLHRTHSGGHAQPCESYRTGASPWPWCKYTNAHRGIDIDSSSTANATGHRHLRAHHLRPRADVWHVRQALGVQHARTDAEYGFWGCDYRADPNNHLFGHLDQVLDNGGGVVLLRYPLCGVIYQPFDDGSDRLLRLSLDEAESILPSSE